MATRFFLALLPALLVPGVAHGQAPLTIPVVPLAQAPTVDGGLTEWGNSGWINIPVKPALPAAERARYGLSPDDDVNQTGQLTVQAKAGVSGDRFYVAFKYPDATADTRFKMWEWRGKKYVESKDREDMFAVRFHLSGDFDRSMLSEKDYKADVWLWSAARSNHGSVAEDMTHIVTTALQESAAEYVLPGGKTVNIVKRRDAGEAPYKMLPRPRENKGESLPAFEPATPSGSAADVAAKGKWAAGKWALEFSRALDTGHNDDVVFKPGQKLTGQIAVFNKGYAEHKSISEPLLFDFSAIK